MPDVAYMCQWQACTCTVERFTPFSSVKRTRESRWFGIRCDNHGIGYN